MVKADILLMTEGYLGDHEPEKTPEEIFAEFSEVLKVNRKFEAYCRKNKIKIHTKGMKRSKAELERRKLFIKWYLESNPNMGTSKACKKLARILFVSEATVNIYIYGYGSF